MSRIPHIVEGAPDASRSQNESHAHDENRSNELHIASLRYKIYTAVYRTAKILTATKLVTACYSNV